MNINRLALRSLLVITLACGCLLPSFPARAGGGGSAGGGSAPFQPPRGQGPDIIQNGFNAWAKNRSASWAFDVWKIGGLMELDNKPVILSRYFLQMEQPLGNYVSYELVETRRLGQNSEVLYVAINFDRAAVFGRFMLYLTAKGWVVQNMDFSPKPEAMMPWLAFEGGTYTQ